MLLLGVIAVVEPVDVAVEFEVGDDVAVEFEGTGRVVDAESDELPPVAEFPVDAEFEDAENVVDVATAGRDVVDDEATGEDELPPVIVDPPAGKVVVDDKEGKVGRVVVDDGEAAAVADEVAVERTAADEEEEELDSAGKVVVVVD